MLSNGPRPVEAGVSRRFALREATAAAHTRVESIIGEAGLFGSLRGYRRYLEATYVMRAGLERDLDLSLAAHLWPQWPDRRIARLVAQDIADLDFEPPKLTMRAQAQDWPEALGVLYVLEGSSLGARLLVRSAADLGLTGAFGARHLHAQAGTPHAWRSFVALLDTVPLSSDGERACRAAANAAFDAFASAYAAVSIRI